MPDCYQGVVCSLGSWRSLLKVIVRTDMPIHSITFDSEVVTMGTTPASGLQRRIYVTDPETAHTKATAIPRHHVCDL